jgi:hypothetical protein
MAMKYDAATIVKRAEAYQARLARDHVVPLALLKLTILTAPGRHHLHVVDVQVEIVSPPKGIYFPLLRGVILHHCQRHNHVPTHIVDRICGNMDCKAIINAGVTKVLQVSGPGGGPSDVIDVRRRPRPNAIGGIQRCH